MTDEEFKDLVERARRGHVEFAQREPVRMIVFNDSNGLWRRVFPDESQFYSALRQEADSAAADAELAQLAADGGAGRRGMPSKKALSKYQAKQLRKQREAEERQAKEEARAKIEAKREKARRYAREHYTPVAIDGRRVSLLRARSFVDRLERQGLLPGRPAQQQLRPAATPEKPTPHPPRKARPFNPDVPHRKTGFKDPSF